MKKQLLFTAVFAMLLLGCSESVETDSKTDEPIIEPIANAIRFDGGVEQTKATMNGDYTFNWEVGDRLAIYAETGGAVYADRKDYSITTAAATSPFEPSSINDAIAWSGKAEHTFYAFYPYNSYEPNPKEAQFRVDDLAQVQNGANSSAHLSKLAIMVATPVKVMPTADKVEQTVNLKFNQIMSFLEFRCTATTEDPTVTVSSIMVKSDQDNIMCAWGMKVDITDPAFPINTSHWGVKEQIILTITGGLPVTKAVQKAYAMVLPYDHSAGTLTFIVNYSNGTKQIITKPGVNLGRAKIRPVNLNLVVPVIKPELILNVASGQTIAQAITASGTTEADITKIVYNSSFTGLTEIPEEDKTAINALGSKSLIEMEFPNITSIAWGAVTNNNGLMKKWSFPALTTIGDYTFVSNTFLVEVDLGLVTDFSKSWSVFIDCPDLKKVTLRAATAITLYGDAWSSTFGADPSTIDLVLNADGVEFKTIVDNTWKGSTFKSITGVKF
ncbi:MAG: fimbrillin family protein [Rikenellaceae bacterium]